VTGCNDKLVRLFDLNDYSSEPLIFTGHTSSIKKCIFLEENKKIVSISEDKTLRVWDTSSKEEIFNLKFESSPNSIELSHDGEILILSTGSSVELYNSTSLEKIKSFVIPSKVSVAR
jgi:WD40 repeat protein